MVGRGVKEYPQSSWSKGARPASWSCSLARLSWRAASLRFRFRGSGRPAIGSGKPARGSERLSRGSGKPATGCARPARVWEAIQRVKFFNCLEAQYYFTFEDDPVVGLIFNDSIAKTLGSSQKKKAFPNDHSI